MPSRWTRVYCNSIATISIYCHQKLKLITSDLLSTKPARSFLNLSWSKKVISGIVCESSSAAILERQAWQSASASATIERRLGIRRRQRACRVSLCALIALLYAFPARTSSTAPGPNSPISPTRQLVRNHSYDPLWPWESSLLRAGHLGEELTYPGIV